MTSGHQKRIKTTTKLRIFNFVIVPTLLYGLESVVLLEPHTHRLQSFVMHCLCIILRVSILDKKRNTSIRKMAQQQRVSSMLSQRRLRLLGHIVRMDDHQLPKQLLVYAPTGGSRAVGGQTHTHTHTRTHTHTHTHTHARTYTHNTHTHAHMHARTYTHIHTHTHTHTHTHAHTAMSTIQRHYVRANKHTSPHDMLHYDNNHLPI